MVRSLLQREPDLPVVKRESVLTARACCMRVRNAYKCFRGS